MNLATANTDAFRGFHRFHERLNRTIKATVVAFAVLEREIARGAKKSELDMVTIHAGGLWGGMPDWTDPPGLLAEARKELGAGALVRCFSAFDLFLERLLAELSSWAEFQRKGTEASSKSKRGRVVIEKAASTGDETDVEKISRTYARLGWPTKALDFFLPVHRYYRLCRNCIAHRDGLASAALAEASVNQAWQVTIDRWKSVTGEESLPRLKTYAPGAQVVVDHRDAILASSLLRRIAHDMNELALRALGPEGLVYMAARETLLANPPTIGASTGRSPIAVIHAALGFDYRVSDLNDAETIALLQRLNIWKPCLKALDEMRLR